jgi:hypothetical protein
MLKIGVNVHAQTDDNPEFELYRQDTTGAIVLKVESGGAYPALVVFLDDETLPQLRKVVNTPVAERS